MPSLGEINCINCHNHIYYTSEPSFRHENICENCMRIYGNCVNNKENAIDPILFFKNRH